jgi:acyl-CoA thioesterase
LTYLSDLGTGFGQQDRKLIGRGGPSIDHSVWFQEDIRADEWVLVDLRPVKARSARGAYHGSLRDRDGALGATIYQEQLLIPGSAADLRAGVFPDDEDLAAESGDPEDAASRALARGEHPAGG